MSTRDLWLDTCMRRHSGENVQNLKSGQVFRAYGAGAFPPVASFPSAPFTCLITDTCVDIVVVGNVKLFGHGEPNAIVEWILNETLH